MGISRARAASLYDQVMQNETEAIVITDLLTRFVDVSAGACSLLGYTRDELLGMSVPDLVPANRKQQFFEALRSGEVGAMRRMRERPEVLCKGGVLLPVEVSVSWLSGGGFLAVFRDLTAQVSAEEMTATLIRETPDGFALHEIICDESGDPVDYRFLMVNPAFEKITGLVAEDIVGKTVLEVMPGTEPHWIKRYGAVALTGVSDSFDEYSAEVGRHFEVKAFRPSPGQFACVFADVSASKELESAMTLLSDRLRGLSAQIVAAEEQRSRDIAVELHDRVSQPLAVAKMALQQCAGGLEATERVPIDHAIALVDKALSESRDLTHEISPAVLHDLGLEAAIEWFVERATRFGVRGRVGTSPRLGSLGDEVKSFLFRAVRELVMNVSKHAGVGAYTVSWGRDDDVVWVAVEDDGVGMGSEPADAVGGGFGLFSIAERARQLGGGLEVTSAPGAGTRMRVSVRDTHS